jgi:formamidase
MGRHHHIGVDFGRPLASQPHVGHNRWHPAIRPVLRIASGDSLVLQALDAMDGQLTMSSTAADVAAASLYRVHPMTGPVYVDGAEPGDLLAVRIDEIEPASFGFTAQIPGSGFLRHEFTEPFLVRWELDGGYAVSADLPGIRISDQSFPGVIGVAPSGVLLRSAAEREADLAARGGAVNLPDPREAVPDDPRIAAEGLRTIPPRENGGNLDIRHLTRGTTVLIPVFTAGALLSCGDVHFAQGDGEVCGTAIEMAATVHLTVTVRKAAATGSRAAAGVAFSRPAAPDGGAPDGGAPDGGAPDGGERARAGYYATTGICVSPGGRNESENATLAAQNAIRAMISHLTDDRGYTRQQAYAICSVAVNLRLSQLVDVPNFVASAFLPLAIFIEEAAG